MTHRTHAVAKTRAHQVRWSSRCRSRTAGAGAGAAAGARGAAAAGRGRTTQLRLSPASTLVDGSPQLQHSSHALLRPQERGPGGSDRHKRKSWKASTCQPVAPQGTTPHGHSGRFQEGEWNQHRDIQADRNRRERS